MSEYNYKSEAIQGHKKLEIDDEEENEQVHLNRYRNTKYQRYK